MAHKKTKTLKKDYGSSVEKKHCRGHAKVGHGPL
jgi:hypothetical protein